MPDFFRYSRTVSVQQFGATYTQAEAEWEKIRSFVKELGLEPDGADEIRISFVKRRDEEQGQAALTGFSEPK